MPGSAGKRRFGSYQVSRVPGNSGIGRDRLFGAYTRCLSDSLRDAESARWVQLPNRLCPWTVSIPRWTTTAAWLPGPPQTRWNRRQRLLSSHDVLNDMYPHTRQVSSVPRTICTISTTLSSSHTVR